MCKGHGGLILVLGKGNIKNGKKKSGNRGVYSVPRFRGGGAV